MLISSASQDIKQYKLSDDESVMHNFGKQLSTIKTKLTQEFSPSFRPRITLWALHSLGRHSPLEQYPQVPRETFVCRHQELAMRMFREALFVIAKC
jgi:hypothetical protein